MDDEAPPPPELPPPEPSSSSTPPPPPDRTLMLILAYLGPLSLVPIIAEKEDTDVQWHAKNGLVLFGAWVVLCILDILLTAVVGVFGCLYTVLNISLFLLYAVLMAVGIAKALRGERLVVPGLTSLAGRF